MEQVTLLGFWPDAIISGAARLYVTRDVVTIDAWTGIRPKENVHPDCSAAEYRARWVAELYDGLHAFIATGVKPDAVCCDLFAWLPHGLYTLESALVSGIAWGAISAFAYTYGMPFYTAGRDSAKRILGEKFRAKKQLHQILEERFELPPALAKKHMWAAEYAVLGALGCIYKDEVTQLLYPE